MTLDFYFLFGICSVRPQTMYADCSNLNPGNRDCYATSEFQTGQMNFIHVLFSLHLCSEDLTYNYIRWLILILCCSNYNFWCLRMEKNIAFQVSQDFFFYPSCLGKFWIRNLVNLPTSNLSFDQSPGERKWPDLNLKLLQSGGSSDSMYLSHLL